MTAETQSAPSYGAEYPAGAIHNGRESLRRLAAHHDFESAGTPLAMCADYDEAVRCFEFIVSALAMPGATQELRVVFDGPPGLNGGRFVEVEDASGHSLRAGEWHARPDGYHELRIAVPTPPTTLTEAVAAARAETEAMATMLADCVGVLQQVPLNQLPGKVDMMLFAALDAPIQGDASRSQLIVMAEGIRAARDAAARAEGVREGLERAADEVEMIAQSWEGDGRAYAMTVAAILRVEEQTDLPPADEETKRIVDRAWERFKAGITPPTTPGGRTDG